MPLKPGSMVRRLSHYSALAFFWLAVSTTQAVRTHEKFFIDTTYYDESHASSTDPLPSPSSKAADLKVVDLVKNDTSSNSEVRPYSMTKADIVALDRSRPTVLDDPSKLHSYEESSDASPTSDSSSPHVGDFMPDARPWWVNPESYNYGNNYQDMNLQQQQQEISQQGIVPDRYPLGYYPFGRRYENPGSQYYSASVSPVQGKSNGQFSDSVTSAQQQYFSQGGFPQYPGSIPFEQTGGGCSTEYWISNTLQWPRFFNVKSNIGEALGTPAANVFGETTLLQGLLDTRTDAYSTLLRTGATAILNSYGRSQYKFTHVQVMESFAAALGSRQAAAVQASVFDAANGSAMSEQYLSCT